MKENKNLSTNLINSTGLHGAKTAIALILLLTFSVSLAVLPAANAHDPGWEIPAYAKLGFSANPIGQGQTTHIYMFLGNLPIPNSAIGNTYRRHNYNLTITAPNGTVEVTQFFEDISDPTGSQAYAFTPQQVGTYDVTFDYLGQTLTINDQPPGSDWVNDTFLASSAHAELVVTQEQLPNPINSYPLPAEYWTRPIYGENTDWWSISSNWLGSGSPGSGGLPGPNTNVFSPDAVGPLTSHIMWTKPFQDGGVVGGDKFPIKGNTWFEGSAYNQRFTNPIIIHGRLYYTEALSFTGVPGFFGGGNYGPTVCVDLLTGEVIWSRTDVPALSFGYIYDVEDPQQHGVYPAILIAASGFGTQTWQAFDAETGDSLFTVNGVPSGTTVLGPQGEHIRYVMQNAGNSTDPDWRLLQWNSTNLWTGIGFPTGNDLSPQIASTVDASTPERYDWNVSIPWRNTMTSNPSTVKGFYDNMLIMRNGSLPSTNADPSIINPYTYFAINLNASRTGYDRGEVLWWKTVTPPEGIQVISNGGADPDVGVFVETYRQTSNWIGYSMKDGHRMWGPTPSQEDFDYFGSQGPGTLADVVAYGKLYSMAYAGILYCYNLTTGKILWTYGNGGEGNSTFGGLGVYYNRYPTFINAIGNGVVYLVTSEHTVETPIYKGSLVRAVNATDGTELWTLSSYVGEFAAISFAMADGYATWFNGYDNQIYSVGRGPSATTVSAPNLAAAYGQPVVIRGTVTDISAGTKQNEQAGRFPNGVAAVSDASMKDWMGYVYQQKPFPSDCTGVPVTIDVMDSNGNYRTIGTTTSDASGTFSLTWTPDIPGNFTVIATFKGTQAYWPSYAETSFTVMTPPEATPAPTPTPAPMTDTYVLGTGIAIIIILVAGIAVIVLMLRKR
jgi:hypothetical protein